MMPVHPPGQQRADVGLPADRVAAGVAEEARLHLAGAEGVLRAEHHRDAETADAVTGQQADRAGGPPSRLRAAGVGRERQPLGGFSRTRCRVSARTWSLLLSAFDAVATDTPAR